MSAAISSLVRVRYPEPEWVLVDECGAKIGRRRVDFLAMNLWTSRGYAIEGFEVKTDRRDWLRELKDPAKADEGMFRFCDRWWLVATPDVAQEDEIPEPWGWLEARSGKLFTRKKAPKLSPQPVTRGVMASILQRCLGINNRRLEDAKNDLFRERYALRGEVEAELRKESGEELTRLRADLMAAHNELAKYQEMNDRYGAARAQDAFRVARHLLDWRGTLGELNQFEESLRRAGDGLREVKAFLSGADETELVHAKSA